MAQPESAKRTRLCLINSSLIGSKLRVAGRVFSYDADTGIIVLVDGKDALLIDVSLALNSQSKVWVTERLSTIMAIGHLEHSDEVFHVPSAPTYASALKISWNLVLRAILVVPSPDLDLTLWNVVLQEEDDS